MDEWEQGHSWREANLDWNDAAFSLPLVFVEREVFLTAFSTERCTNVSNMLNCEPNLNLNITIGNTINCSAGGPWLGRRCNRNAQSCSGSVPF